MLYIYIYKLPKIRKIFTDTTNKMILSFMVFSDVNRSFISNKIAFTKYCLFQWISKLPGTFQIHCVRQWLLDFTGFAGMINATVYKTTFSTDLDIFVYIYYYNYGRPTAVMKHISFLPHRRAMGWQIYFGGKWLCFNESTTLCGTIFRVQFLVLQCHLTMMCVISEEPII